MITSLLKNLTFVIVAPGSLLVFLPYLLLSGTHARTVRDRPAALLVAAIFMATGIVILVWCVWNFARVGRGTPAPIDPPRNLVVTGAYRYVRNPMYLAVGTILFSETILFRSGALLFYMLLCCVGFHLFVVFYEEPTLRRRFGASYVAYCGTTFRWLPHLRSPRSRRKSFENDDE